VTGGTWVAAIDVGGTFTDAIALRDDGVTRVAKVASTPPDPAGGLIEALRELSTAGVELDRIKLLFHGTTVATNAVLTDRLAHAVLVTTEGFRDTLSYRGGTRPDLYSLAPHRPSELVSRRDRVEARERLSGLGEVVHPLSADEVDRVVDEVARREPEAVAIAFLFSYLDDRHERAMGTAVEKRLPGVPVTLSSEIAREFREYPRTATAALSAGLRPVVGRYLLHARDEAAALGARAPFLVMQSNGGCVPAERAEREADRLLLSGPVAGVTGAVALGARYGLRRLISLDMGGTSLDVCLVNDGTPPVSPVQIVQDHPILCPSVDIVTAGAGGGSIARVDRAGRLHVGPQSAGAIPGPAAYGLGGVQATLTDAHVAIGTLGGDSPLAGRLALDVGSAREAVERVGHELRLSVGETARGIVAVTLAHTTRMIRRVSVERGIDPRDYTLVAFGGAGPLHAPFLLRELALSSVLVPAHPGLFSAEGLVAADVRVDDSQTILRVMDPSIQGTLSDWYHTAGDRLRRRLRDDGIPASRIRVVASADCRYVGQGYELNVPLDGAAGPALRRAAADFHRLHAAAYDHANPGERVEIVTVRLSAFGALHRPAPATTRRGARTVPAAAARETRPLLLPGHRGRVRARVLRREELRAGNHLPGPAVVEQMDATTLVLPGQVARVDTHGNMWITEGRRE
jgi:N-methylhydantoinase A